MSVKLQFEKCNKFSQSYSQTIIYVMYNCNLLLVLMSCIQIEYRLNKRNIARNCFYTLD